MFSILSKAYLKLLLVLHTEIARRTIRKGIDKLFCFMQDVPLNIGIPIFKICKIQHFVTIGETCRFELTVFHLHNIFISKAKFILKS